MPPSSTTVTTITRPRNNPNAAPSIRSDAVRPATFTRCTISMPVRLNTSRLASIIAMKPNISLNPGLVTESGNQVAVNPANSLATQNAPIHEASASTSRTIPRQMLIPTDTATIAITMKSKTVIGNGSLHGEPVDGHCGTGIQGRLSHNPGSAGSVTLPYHGGIADHQFQSAHALARNFGCLARVVGPDAHARPFATGIFDDFGVGLEPVLLQLALQRPGVGGIGECAELHYKVLAGLGGLHWRRPGFGLGCFGLRHRYRGRHRSGRWRNLGLGEGNDGARGGNAGRGDGCGPGR